MMWKKAIAEGMGTLFLVLIGAGAVVFGDGMLSIALAFGLSSLLWLIVSEPFRGLI